MSLGVGRINFEKYIFLFHVSQCIESHKILDSHIFHSSVNIYNTEYENSQLFRLSFIRLKRQTKEKRIISLFSVHYVKHISADFPFFAIPRVVKLVSFLKVKIFGTERREGKTNMDGDEGSYEGT